MANVKLQNVTKVFEPGLTAVNNVDIDVKDKELMVIVGPSGCGKTTILRMIAGLEQPTAGKISIAGRIVNNLPPKDRDIAMVFQNYALYPHMTVFQNMAFALKLRKLPKDQIRQTVQTTAKMLGIDHLLSRRPKALSGGQRQRVALGRAVVRNPNAFLLDEPLSNLDPALRITTRTEIKALHRRLRTTTIYVTHDQAEAMTLGDRICVLRQGAVQQIAPPMDLYAKPVNKFVAGFLGTPPMNFFPGRIEFKDSCPHFIMDDSSIPLPESSAPGLLPYNSKPMTLGIRPQDLSLTPYPGQKQTPIPAKVSVVEPLGDRTDVILETPAGRKFTITLPPQTKITSAQNLKLHPNTKTTHIFEPTNTEKNITLSQP